MKIELGQLKNKFKNIYLLGSKPIQDWQRIIYVMTAILIGVFVWSYFFYFSVQSEFKSDIFIPPQSHATKDKESEIQEVMDKYINKEKAFYEYSSTVLGSTTIASTTSVSAKPAR